MSENGVGNTIQINRLATPRVDPSGPEAIPGFGESHDGYLYDGKDTFEALKRRAEELVPRYAGSFIPLFVVIAEWFQTAWATFDHQGCKALRESAQRLTRALSIPLQEEWVKRYRNALEVADLDFRAMVREALGARQVRETRKDEESGHLDGEITAIQSRQADDLAALESRMQAELEPLTVAMAEKHDAVDRYTVGLSGVETHQIKPPRYEADRARRWLKWTLLVVCASVLTLVETIIGAGIIVEVTNAIVGMVLVLALAVGSTVVIHVAMGELRLFVSYLQAKWRFRKAHPGGAHPRGYAVFPFPISKALIAITGTLLLAASIAGPLWYRIALISGSSEDLGSIAGPIGLAFIMFVVAMTMFFSAKDFTDEQYADLRQLQEARKSADEKVELKRAEMNGLLQARRTELAELLEHKRHERAQRQVPLQPISYEDAKNHYDNVVDTAEQAIRSEAAELEKSRLDLLELYSWYEMMWDAFRNAAPSVMNHLVLLISQTRSGGVPEFQDSDRAQARQLFEQGAVRKHHDPGFAKALVTHRFVPELPVNERLTDFLAVITAIEEEAKPKPIIAPVV